MFTRFVKKFLFQSSRYFTKKMRLLRNTRVLFAIQRCNCSSSSSSPRPLQSSSNDRTNAVEICGNAYPRDDWTNVTPHIASLVGRSLHNASGHPINLIKRRVFDFFHSAYRNARGNPVFSAHDDLCPVVRTVDNFDSLLIGEGHVSRAKKDNYYVNKDYLLRSHTSAHQLELLRMGCDDFLVAGDVYRSALSSWNSALSDTTNEVNLIIEIDNLFLNSVLCKIQFSFNLDNADLSYCR